MARNKPVTLGDTEYLSERKWYSIGIKDDSVFFKCTKTSKCSDEQYLALFDKSIDRLNVVSTSCKSDKWKVDAQGTSLLGRFWNFLWPRTSSCFSLSIHFWTKVEKHRRYLYTMKFQTYDERDCKALQELIEIELKKTLNKYGYARPHNLLVIVNPYSGKKKGRSIYRDTVSPLCKVAGIKETLVYTEYVNHAREITEACDLSKYDGIVVVSGDGTFSEAANGVLINERQKQGVSLDKEGVIHKKPLNLLKSKVKLGLIPAGSANCTAWSSQGIEDPETAALQIISGESHPLDVCSVYDAEEKFLQFSAMCSFYGFLSKVSFFSESLRMLGPGRYDIGILYSFFKHQSYPCELTLFLNSADSVLGLKKNISKCRFPCSVCLTETEEFSKASSVCGKDGPPASPNCSGSLKIGKMAQGDATDTNCKQSSDEKDLLCKVIRGNFHMVDSFSSSFMYEKSPEGFAPYVNLADGTADLYLVHSTTRGGFMRFMNSRRRSQKNVDFSFVDVHRAKGYRLLYLAQSELETLSLEKQTFAGETRSIHKNENNESCQTPPKGRDFWAVDGDCTDNNNFTLWVHKDLLDIFSKGIES